MTLYAWLNFLHLAGLAAFLFAHGISGGASLALRGPVSGYSRSLLRLSQRSGLVSNPALLVVLITGIWMTFAAQWWSRGWPWASLAVLFAVLGVMFYVARPYYMARDAVGGPDDALAERLHHTRPMLAVWAGAIGLIALVALMVFKPF
ncbi:MAG: hypothetical protein AUI15_27960 [Actinobacteria bacterium 13_2_20CM_2_66_6]|nr:MAG: hypothetical protein AUI15_27960 [Actinobacteria bacterium 13_2_20CM_2_66_6]